MRRAAVSLLATALLSGLLAGCSDDPSAPDVNAPKVDVDTPALREQKARLGVEDCADGDGTGEVEGGLPQVTLACFGGGPGVDVSTLRGPLVINFWQGACVPCRQEMPALEEFHQRYGDEVPVLGIDYLDAQPGYAMDLVESRTSQPGVNVFKQALANLKPVVEVKSRRVGGATYQVPVEVRPERRTALAMRWLISYSRDRNEKSMAEKLAAEVVAASKGEGNAIKKKDDTHRMAEANKAFAHYRW